MVGVCWDVNWVHGQRLLENIFFACCVCQLRLRSPPAVGRQRPSAWWSWQTAPVSTACELRHKFVKQLCIFFQFIFNTIMCAICGFVDFINDEFCIDFFIRFQPTYSCGSQLLAPALTNGSCARMLAYLLLAPALTKRMAMFTQKVFYEMTKWKGLNNTMGFTPRIW